MTVAPEWGDEEAIEALKRTIRSDEAVLERNLKQPHVRDDMTFTAELINGGTDARIERTGLVDTEYAYIGDVDYRVRWYSDNAYVGDHSILARYAPEAGRWTLKCAWRKPVGNLPYYDNDSSSLRWLAEIFEVPVASLGHDEWAGERVRADRFRQGFVSKVRTEGQKLARTLGKPYPPDSGSAAITAEVRSAEVDLFAITASPVFSYTGTARYELHWSAGGQYVAAGTLVAHYVLKGGEWTPDYVSRRPEGSVPRFDSDAAELNWLATTFEVEAQSLRAVPGSKKRSGVGS